VDTLDDKAKAINLCPEDGWNSSATTLFDHHHNLTLAVCG
jgi:hypothetical protein